MTQTDLELLLEMGFEKARAELAVKKTGGLQGALTWLEENQDKPLEELQETKATDDGEDEEAGGPSISSLQEVDGAKSIICNECGKIFRNKDLASYHASKTDHTDFSESTEEIKPLTKEEREAKLSEARQRLQEKKALQALKDKEDAKKNEQIRMKATKETQDLKEELQRKEQIKEAAKKRQEKQDDMDAKRRIKAKIEADKEERRRKAEQAKAAREGRPIVTPSTSAAAAPPAPPAPKPATTHTEARVKLQTPSGNLMKTYPAETTLFEIAQGLDAEDGIQVKGFSTTFPKKTYQDGLDFSKTLKEIGCVPSAVLIVHAA